MLPASAQAMPTSSLAPEQKRYRERANRARRNLLNQQKEFSTIRDDSGIRYLVVPWYVLDGEPAEAAEFGVWFEWKEEFLEAPTDLERSWIRSIWGSEPGVRLREPDARGEVLAEWQALLHQVLGEQPGAS